MQTIKRGDDAADHAPTPRPNDGSDASPSAKQDAPNYDQRTDKGQALEVEDVNSANDEGAA